MKIALLDVKMLADKRLPAFIREQNVGCAIVSSDHKDVFNPLDVELFIQKDLSIQNFVFRNEADTLILFDTYTKDWKRIYFRIFSEEEMDEISVLTEQINCSIDKYNAKYSGK